jgi:hypothetical protein
MPEVLNFIVESQKEFIVTLCSCLITCQVSKSIASSSTYFTQLLTFINRTIVVKPDFVVQQCLG